MKNFELKLGNTEYKCSASQYGGGHNNWTISAKFHDLKLSMDIPIESKVSMDKVLVFISSLDEALKIVQQEKSKELTFLNQLT